MKVLLGAFVLLLFSGTRLLSQIALGDADYPAELVGTDTLKQTVYSSVFPAISTGPAQVWDFSTIVDSSSVQERFLISVPVYQVGDSMHSSLGSYKYFHNSLVSVWGLGIKEFGQSTVGAEFDLFSLTSIPTDTLFIPQQTQLNSVPCDVLRFPCSYGNSWESVYAESLAYELSVGAYSLDHEACMRRRFVVRHDTVSGWGQMRVPDFTGFPSPFHDVLQIRTRVHTVDSFYMGGAVMPSPLVTLLSLVQGKKDSSYKEYYYRKGEVTPLAEITYTDATYSIPTSARTHKQRLYPSGIANTSNGADVNIYPNPVSGHVVFISAPGSLRYKLFDVQGRQVTTVVVQGQQQPYALSLSTEVTPGTYLMQLRDEKGNYSGMLLTVE